MSCEVSRSPRVFISYAQFCEVHSERVLTLAQSLRGHGIDVELDQYHKTELIDWPRWCQEQLRPDRSDWVIMVCSTTYRDRLENRVDPHTGKGVSWEGALIDDEIYEAKGNSRFVPVLLDDEPEESIPGIVRGWTHFRIRGLDHGDPGYENLYRLLTGQPTVGKAPIGAPVILKARPIEQDDKPVLDTESVPARKAELHYLDGLLADIEIKARLYAPLRGIAEIRPSAGVDALLAPWRDEEDIALLMHRPRKRTGAQTETQQEYDDILTAFGDVKRAALIGPPGAGKSTTLRRLAADLAQIAREDPQKPLPFLVSLGDWRGDEALAAFLAERLPEIGWAAQSLSEAGRLVLLLDGLNEVPTAKRQEKADSILAFMKGLPQSIPFIVSCRQDDYVGNLDLGLDTLSLEPLSPRRVREVLHHWLPDDNEEVEPGSGDRLFWQLAGDERLAGVLATWLAADSTEDAFWSVSDPSDDKKAYAKTSGNEDEIWRRHVPNPRSLLRLAANPFMLTMLYQVWAFEGELPRNRGDLFTRFIDRLLSRERLFLKNGDTGQWERTPDGERLLSGLQEIAWIMQGERVGRKDEQAEDFGVLTVLPQQIAVKELGGDSLLKKAEDATLIEGTDDIRFRHQLLQEYFTASAMRFHIEDTPPMAAAELWPAENWWERSGWEESAILLAGFYADDCTPVIRWLRDAQPEVAAQCILESGSEIADRDALYRELHDAWLPRLTAIDSEPAPEARAAVGRALGRLGLDARKGVGIDANGRPDIDWVEIAGGDFIYQDGERRRVDTFRISRYPITNAQFQAFLDAEDGYANDRWWQGLEGPDRNPGQPRWDIANHPRETLSWFEAVAFCAWISWKTGLDIRLPTEWEWERATRGTDGRIYPWGNDYRPGSANINETWDDVGPHYLDRTTAVGIYPNGSSPEGVLDLSGNVWERCLNEYSNPERTQLGGQESRVVRGGSWGGDQSYARAANRTHAHPHDRYVSSGCRLVCASPIPSGH